MTSTMMMERTGMSMPGMTPTPGMPATMPVGPNYLMVPRCAMKFEKCAGGMKITCCCDDAIACGMMQNLCMMLQNGLCSVCCTMNGMAVCCCSLTMGACTCEMTAQGCCVTCTSGDPKCCEMIQACCDCLASLCAAGCTCCLMMNNTPVCCGVSPPAKTAKGR